jgi:hypothetical protein
MVGVSAPTPELAAKRLTGYATAELIGENPRLAPYDYAPRALDWLSRPIERGTHPAPLRAVCPSKPKRQAAPDRVQQLMAERGIDRQSASLLAAMEKANRA